MSVDKLNHLHTTCTTSQVDDTTDPVIPDTTHTCKRWLRGFVDVDLLLHPACLVICVAALLIQLAYFVPIVFITNFAGTINVGAQKGSFLISIMGEYIS